MLTAFEASVFILSTSITSSYKRNTHSIPVIVDDFRGQYENGLYIVLHYTVQVEQKLLYTCTKGSFHTNLYIHVPHDAIKG